MMVGNLKDNFILIIKVEFCHQTVKLNSFFVRPLSELHVSSQTTYVISTDLTVSSADFTTFFQDEGKSIKRGENLHISSHAESCSYSKGELVGSVSQRRENVLMSVTRLVLPSL